MFEVEMKFAVSDPRKLKKVLEEKYRCSFKEEKVETDLFFQHCTRDFRITDECLRLRRIQNQAWLTYKGPKLDGTTKTREEIEIPLLDKSMEPQGDENRLSLWRTLFLRLGFHEADQLTKVRQEGELNFEGRTILLTLDSLPDVGTFTELELMVSTQEELSEARATLFRLARELDLGEGIRSSYLELSKKEGRPLEKL